MADAPLAFAAALAGTALRRPPLPFGPTPDGLAIARGGRPDCLSVSMKPGFLPCGLFD